MKKVILIIVIIILVVAIGTGVYFIYKTTQESTSKSTTTPSKSPSQTASGNVSPSASGNSQIEKTYEETKEVEATGTKTKAFDTEIRPIFKEVFADKVKLKEDFGGSMLTYVVNRQIKAEDVTAVKTKMEALGYKAIDSSEKQITMTQTGKSYVISFSVGATDKGEIQVTL
jgi:uncharacterized protein YxeA